MAPRRRHYFHGRSAVWLVAGANTNIGKTVVSALLCSGAKEHCQVHYIKPVQTGYPTDSDAAFVAAMAKVTTNTLFSFSEPVSPHLAETMDIEKRLVASRVGDSTLQKRTLDAIKEMTSSPDPKMVFVETAGGVNSPVMSGSLQSDVYRPLRLPVILVGDANLGGISTTLASYDSLKLRGYDIPFIVMFDNPQYSNHTLLQQQLGDQVKIHVVPPPPQQNPDKATDQAQLKAYLLDNLATSSAIARDLALHHTMRIERLQHLQTQGKDALWWPFTQHNLVGKPMVIDSAFRDELTVLDPLDAHGSSTGYFDACASWWTNGLGHGNARLSK
ncbi:hypothetical protein HDU91_002849, partial [Kappamyces sp. JEL0680]